MHVEVCIENASIEFDLYTDIQSKYTMPMYVKRDAICNPFQTVYLQTVAISL